VHVRFLRAALLDPFLTAAFFILLSPPFFFSPSGLLFFSRRRNYHTPLVRFLPDRRGTVSDTSTATLTFFPIRSLQDGAAPSAFLFIS